LQKHITEEFSEANNSSSHSSESIPQERRHTPSLIHLLNNLTDNESQLLTDYVQQRAYANLKEMIDERINYIDDFEDGEIFTIADKYTESELFLRTLNLSEKQLEIIHAYQVIPSTLYVNIHRYYFIFECIKKIARESSTPTM
uniref:Sigma70_r1_2 domain-containing protein n=1 Tax=Ascaris lumbricoides TaxID=6252 RepID=A0A0M3I7V6_ASCLU